MTRILALPLLTLALPAPLAAAVDFNREVRPLLSDNCFACHGPDAAKREAGLRLDDREAALLPAESGKVAIVPGKPDESELVRRILTTDGDDLMPPDSSHKKLTPSQKETLRQWIAEGAEYRGHWAFEVPVRREIPDRSIPKPKTSTPIDTFLAARLAREGLNPQPEAPKETLIRRATLDLTGLPPTLAEVDAFLADISPQAYEKVVDRLLASPRYGEHMAAAWLDFARYADSNGFQSDTKREQWLWRDWVIHAFNDNMPFDQFTIEQLAGDLLPNATPQQIVATGFNRNHRLNGEGGRIVEEWFAENVIDRVETTGLTWMALTLNCCRCHDHKYDPISQKEFYQLFAYFNSIDESGVMDDFGGAGRTRAGGNSRPVIFVPTAEQAAKEKSLAAAIQEAEARLAASEKELPALQAKWEPEFAKQTRSQQQTWCSLLNENVKSEGGATFTRQPDGTWLAGGKNPEHDVYIITAPLPPGQFTGVQIQALPDASLPAQSLGRYPNGNFVLTDIDAEITAPGMKEPVEAQFTSADADYEQKGWEVDFIVKDKPKRGKGAKNRQGWAVDGPTKKEPRTAVFACAPVNVPGGASIKITLRHDAIAGHNMGRFKVATTSLPPSLVKVKGGAVPAEVLAALNTESAKRTPAQQTALAKFFRDNTANPAREAETALAAAKKAHAALEDDMPGVMVMKESAKPRDAFILKRGEYDKPGEKVTRGLPAALPPLPAGAPNNRLGFAQWLVSGQHPLTARVWVNRQWEKFFGTGLVKTSENFGVQAEFPSHPELLDWLATEFVRLKWDMKAMQKLMVMSTAYRQSAKITPQVLERDPENRLLARGPRFRLSGEALRDQALALSGLLVPAVGGESVRPYMPPGVWDETSVYGDLRNYQPDKGDALYRRTLYTIWKRTAAPPTMLLFDSPTREICTVKRSRTNTPTQALALLNEVTFVEAARQLAARMLKEGGSDPAARIAWAFRTVTARRPSSEELSVLVARHHDRLTRYRANTEAAKRLIAQGASAPDASLDPAELAAATVTANVLLNLDEVVTRE
jgi:mono/diheme cytochrome c family protein